MMIVIHGLQVTKRIKNTLSINYNVLLRLWTILTTVYLDCLRWESYTMSFILMNYTKQTTIEAIEIN